VRPAPPARVEVCGGPALMLRQRVLTAAVLLPLFVGAILFLSSPYWGAGVVLVAALGAFEWARLMPLPPRASRMFALCVALSCGALLVWPDTAVAGALLLAGAGFWVVAAPWILATRDRPRSPRLLLAIGWLVMVSAWVGLYLMQASGGRLLALLAVVWIADSAAYFAGRRYGKHKLAPALSPGKTWEGVAGAVLAVAVYYVLLWFVFAPQFLRAAPFTDALLVVAMTVLSIEGDLFESWLKRRAGVKDSGQLLPGHGGVLDRIDGVLAVVPLAAAVGWLQSGMGL